MHTNAARVSFVRLIVTIESVATAMLPHEHWGHRNSIVHETSPGALAQCAERLRQYINISKHG